MSNKFSIARAAHHHRITTFCHQHLTFKQHKHQPLTFIFSSNTIKDMRNSKRKYERYEHTQTQSFCCLQIHAVPRNYNRESCVCEYYSVDRRRY